MPLSVGGRLQYWQSFFRVVRCLLFGIREQLVHEQIREQVEQTRLAVKILFFGAVSHDARGGSEWRRRCLHW